MPGQRLKGQVKWFDPKKGYGFITSADGKDYFVHYTAIQSSGFRSLNQGDEVEFEYEETSKGLQATQVFRNEKPEA